MTMTNQTALLVMDMQKGIADNVPQINSLIKANQRAIEAARAPNSGSIYACCIRKTLQTFHLIIVCSQVLNNVVYP